jgi:sulfide:quinone oxidoreductase
MPGKDIVILGGGFGGVRAAITARALLPAEHNVTLIDRNRRTHICGALPLLIVGERETLQTSRSLGRLANRGISFVQSEATRIDIAGRSVRTAAAAFEYDHLVIATGAEYNWDAVPGARAAHSFYDIGTARRLRARLARFKRGRIVFAVAATPYKCPPAPYEAAMILRWHLKRAGASSSASIHCYTPEPLPLPVAGQAACDVLSRDLASRGIGLRTNAGVKEVAPDGRSALFTDGSSLDADVIITVPVHRLPGVVTESGVAGGKPWVGVNAATLETSTPGVFAIGDVNAVLMGNGRPMPKAGVFASSEGETVARLIASRVLGTEPPPAFAGEGKCFLAYSGRQSGGVSGSFLVPGGPKVQLEPPSRSGMRAKERFELDWRRFRI